MLRTLLFSTLLGLVACGGATDANQPDPNVRRYTLEASIGNGQGLMLSSGVVVEDSGDADINLHLGMAFQLTGPDGAFSFCDKGSGYADVYDVPTDLEDCDSSYVFLGAGNPHDGGSRSIKNDGYLVPDAEGRWYAVRIVTHSISAVAEGGVGRVTFDVLALE